MPVITVFCLLSAQVIKVFTVVDNKHLPAFCGISGLLLGVACFYLIPGYIPAPNALAAGGIGVVSGWAATGASQVVKQYGG